MTASNKESRVENRELSSTAQSRRSERDSPRRHGDHGGLHRKERRQHALLPQLMIGFAFGDRTCTEKNAVLVTHCPNWFCSPCSLCLRGESCAAELRLSTPISQLLTPNSYLLSPNSYLPPSPHPARRKMRTFAAGASSAVVSCAAASSWAASWSWP